MSQENEALETLKEQRFKTRVSSLASKYDVTEEFVSSLFTQERQEIYSHWETFVSHLPEQLDQNEVLVNKLLWRIVEANIRAHKAEEKAALDHLTQIPNRRALDLALEKYIANFQRGKRDKINKPFCVILFDLDNFKGINDVFGYNTGDTVLKIVAKIAQSKIRPVDFIARYGGEEFVIIFNGEIGDAINLANRIKTSFLEIDVRDLEINPSIHPNITASFGVAQYDEEKTSVFERANNYTKRAKEGGKNMVFY